MYALNSLSSLFISDPLFLRPSFLLPRNNVRLSHVRPGARQLGRRLQLTLPHALGTSIAHVATSPIIAACFGARKAWNGKLMAGFHS